MGRRRYYFFFLTVSTRRLESANGFKLSRKKKNKTKNKKQKNKKKTYAKDRLACITEALYEPSEANAAFCTKRETKGEKNKAPVTSPLFWLFRPPAPTSSSAAIAGKWFPYDRYDRCDAIVANLKLVNQAFS